MLINPANAPAQKRTGISTRLVPCIALFVYCIINALFIQKYSSRALGFPGIVSAGYCIIVCAAVCLYWYKASIVNPPGILFYIAGALFTAFGVAVFLNVPALSLEVDRWSVITSFLDNVFNGKFPYTARSHVHNLPGPFPFYFVLALPFYAVGSIGAMVLAGYWLFAGCARYWYSHERDRLFVIILLCASPAFVWEVVCRSTIFFNAVVICVFMFMVTYRVKNATKTPAGTALLFCIGIAGGCIISTRGTIAFPLLCFYSFLFLRDKKYRSYCVTMLGSAAGFILTFLPLLFWNADLFIHNNPFILQSYSIPRPFLLLFVAAAVAFGTFCRSLYFVFFAQGILMFLLVAVPFLTKISYLGFTKAFYLSSFDISYFLFVLPFALLTIIYIPQDT